MDLQPTVANFLAISAVYPQFLRCLSPTNALVEAMTRFGVVLIFLSLTFVGAYTADLKNVEIDSLVITVNLSYFQFQVLQFHQSRLLGNQKHL
jgi:hypothetical protein